MIQFGLKTIQMNGSKSFRIEGQGFYNVIDKWLRHVQLMGKHYHNMNKSYDTHNSQTWVKRITANKPGLSTVNYSLQTVR